MAQRADDVPRESPRVHGSEAVEVFTSGTAQPMVGVIRDISQTGAYIRIATAQDLPQQITLSSPTAGDRRAATIRWRDETRIGISFDEPVSD